MNYLINSTNRGEKVVKRIIALAIVALMASASYAIAQEKTYGDIDAVTYVRNYDGDTITFDIDGVPSIIGENMPVRLYGVDTPEMHGKCELEKQRAKKAKAVVADELKNAKQITLKNVMRGKYFRIVADIETENGSLAQKLLDKNLAVEYYGGTKVKDWCAK